MSDREARNRAASAARDFDPYPGEFLEPLLVIKVGRKPIGRDAMLRLDDTPNSPAVTAQLRRERGGRPHSRKPS